MHPARRSATPRRALTSRSASRPPSDERAPPSKRAMMGLPTTGDRPGKGSVISMSAGMVSGSRHTQRQPAHRSHAGGGGIHGGARIAAPPPSLTGGAFRGSLLASVTSLKLRGPPPAIRPPWLAAWAQPHPPLGRDLLNQAGAQHGADDAVADRCWQGREFNPMVRMRRCAFKGSASGGGQAEWCSAGAHCRRPRTDPTIGSYEARPKDAGSIGGRAP
jgi:hypothetical protein